MKRVRSFLAIVFFSIGFFANGQSEIYPKQLISLLPIYQYGYVFPTNQFLKGANIEQSKINVYQSFALKVGKQTNGEKIWQQEYNYPYWGTKLYVADFFAPEEVGTPIVAAAFFTAPFLRREKWTLNYDLNLGIAFNWSSFNPLSNPDNISIGAKQSFYVEAGLNFEYKIYKRFYISGGVSLTHFSNGALKMPNAGINTISPNIGFRYVIYKDAQKLITSVIPKKEDNFEWNADIYFGLKNVIFDSLNVDLITKYEGAYFPIFGLSSSINRKVGRKNKFGIGFSISYDGSHDAQIAIAENDIKIINSPFSTKLQLSIFPSYELVIDKLSILIQPSFYVYRMKVRNQTLFFYQRVGIKYHITNSIYAGLRLRAYGFHESDFIEWNIGYRIKWI